MAEKPFRLRLTAEAQIACFSHYCKKSTYSHKHIVTLRDKLVRPSVFVTNLSSVVFNSVLQAFNHEDIRAHLKRCWDVMLRKCDEK